MNFTQVRRDVPLRDADFAAIRARVMREIETVAGRRSPVAGRGWWLAAAAAVIAIVFLAWPTRKAGLEDGLKPAPHHPAIVAQVVAAASATGDRRPATVHHVHHVTHRKPAPQIALRMEIQTADPDVRIIWITR